MSKADSSGAIRFTTEVLNEATEILRPHARPHALPLLLELLWVWEKEALPGYLSLKMKSAAQLLKIRKIAADLVASISALDDGNRFEIACKAELQARVLLDERWDLAVAFGPPDLIPAGERKRDNAFVMATRRYCRYQGS